MTILISTVAIVILFLTGCSEDDTIKAICTEQMLSEHKMIEYNGQEVGCKSFLELYHFRNEQFYLLGNHCADMISYPTDCDGNILCENEMDATCKDFYENAERIGIIGIAP